MNTWSEVREIQPLAEKILTNSIKKGRISHAYLLHGERGTGKEAIALLMAKVLFCKEKERAEPCHHCVHCRRIDSRNHPDVHWIEPDGKSIKTEQIENLQKEFVYTGLESNRKVYVIKDADTLTINASNRILKFLEEPSRETTAIMLTENGQSILPTIRSRCQIIELKPLQPKMLQKRLMHQGMDEDNAKFFSALTNNLTEAETWHEDGWFAETRRLVVQLLEKFLNNRGDVYLFLHDQWIPHFQDRGEQEKGLDVMLLAFKDILYEHIGLKEDQVFLGKDILERAVLVFSQEKVTMILHEILHAKRKLKQNVQPVFVFEQLALQIQR